MTDDEKINHLFDRLDELVDQQRRRDQRNNLMISFFLGIFLGWIFSTFVFFRPAYGLEQGFLYFAEPYPSVIIEGDQSDSNPLCRRGATWSINPTCCCMSEWCHDIPCSRFNFQTNTLILHPGDHPHINRSIIWENIPGNRIEYSVEPGRCIACTSGTALSCVIIDPGHGF